MPVQQYHPVAKYLHWIVAAMVVLQFVLANAADGAGSERLEFEILANHKSVGITIFALALLRLAWRLRQGIPRPLPMPQWQLTASRISHWSMYALILLLPVTGWLTSSASGSSVSWFNLIDLPDLISADSRTEETLEEIHELHAKLLFAIALVHVAATARHWLQRQQVLARMTSIGSFVAFVAIIISGSLWLTRGSEGARSNISTDNSLAADESTRLDPWVIDYGASYLGFRAMQAGVPVEGEWQRWRADLYFDAARLSDCLFDVVVAVASVETLHDDRDTVLQEREWFDAENHPEVRYRATRCQRLPDDRYSAAGTLTVKGRDVPVSLHFTLERVDGRYVMDGTARLDRLRLGLGLGESSDTRWIGQFVTISAHVEASAPH